MNRFLFFLIAFCLSASAQPIIRNTLTTNALPNVLYDSTTGRLTIGTPTAAGPTLLTLTGSLGMTNGIYVGTGTMGNGNNLQLWQTNGESFLSFGKAVGAYSFSLYDNFNQLPMLKLRGSGIADLTGNWRPLNVGPTKLVTTDASTNLTGVAIPGNSNVFFNGNGAFTAVPGSGITNAGLGTANTLAIWTGTNSLGNSTITDDGSGTISSSASTFIFGPDDGMSNLSIRPTGTVNGHGASFDIVAGLPGVSGNAGELRFGTEDGVGTGGGGDILFRAGVGAGGGGDGVLRFTATFTNAVFDVQDLIPANDNSSNLGTNGNRWLNVWSYGVDVDGDIRVSGNVSPRDVPYIWPVAQGAAGTALINDGTGVLSWTPTNAASAETTATNLVQLSQVGTNVTQLDFSLVSRGGAFFITATNNCFIGTPTGFGSSPFTKAWLFFRQPSTGTCALVFTNGSFASPEGATLVVDTNGGSTAIIEFVSDPFTNGLMHMSLTPLSKRIP